MESLLNETTETDFNSTLSDDGILFSSHSVNTSIDLESHNNNSNYNTITSDTTNNAKFYENHIHRKPDF